MTMNTPRVDLVRQLALRRAEANWRGYRRNGAFTRLMNKLLRFHAPDRLYVVERPWDGVARELVEPPVRAWFVDGHGLQVAPLEYPFPVEQRGMYCSVFSIDFGFSPDGLRMLWEEVCGPRAGVGLECWLSPDGPPLRVERSTEVWIS